MHSGNVLLTAISLAVVSLCMAQSFSGSHVRGNYNRHIASAQPYCSKQEFSSRLDGQLGAALVCFQVI